MISLVFLKDLSEDLLASVLSVTILTCLSKRNIVLGKRVMNTTVLYSIYDIYFTQLFVKANLFANNFKYFYSKDCIFNQENIFIFDYILYRLIVVHVL